MVDQRDLAFARGAHEIIQDHVKNGRKANAVRARRGYHRWLAARHLHEVWEWVDRRYQLVALVCTAGSSWGGA